MALSRRQRSWLQRGSALVLAAVVTPLLVSAATVVENAPVVEGEPSPRTIIASDTVRVVDEEATRQAREEARRSVGDQYTQDSQARAEIISGVQTTFQAVREVRAPEPASGGGGQGGGPTPSETVASTSEQLERLEQRIGDRLDPAALRTLVRLSDAELEELSEETLGAAQQLAREQIRPDDLESELETLLDRELAVRSFPGDTGERVAEPLLRAVAQPTMQLDEEATEALRERRVSEVADITRTFEENDPIVTEGEIVGPVALQALEQLGLAGSDPLGTVLRAAAAMLAVILAGVVYLRRMQPRVWRSGRKLLLLASVVAGYGLLVAGVGMLAHGTQPGWWYAVPVGAVAMLAAILVNPVVGLATVLPGVVLVELASPQSAGVPLFVAATVLVSVPLVTDLSSRSDLRSATVRTGAIYPALAFVSVVVFGPRDEALVAAVAGLANALVTGLIVQGLLPFLETSFRLPTVTALLDLADRNHPLLRELEQKALGSYNHSVMVASLVERGCREIGANSLLGSVAALYHDIGKVRQPHFFIENQRGIPNPHDDLEPEVSAIIIQNHVRDGVEMAREHHLPPEVVACIHSHHGTMLVTYFYRRALERAGGDLDKVDADHYRYKGSRPSSKEAAILMMADCSEAATRSAAMDAGTLPREEIETLVDHLLQERIDDGQFDHCDLTFAEMSRVRDSIVEALVGIYHPRIAYPSDEAPEARPVPNRAAGLSGHDGGGSGDAADDVPESLPR